MREGTLKECGEEKEVSRNKLKSLSHIHEGRKISKTKHVISLTAHEIRHNER